MVFARLLSAVLQRLHSREYVDLQFGVQLSKLLVPDCASGLGDAGGYYSGIAASTCVFGVFLSVEAWLYFRRCQVLERVLRGKGI